MSGVLKAWHKWSWAFHILVWLIMGTTMLVTYRDSLATNTKDIADYKSQNLPTRMAVQENSTNDIKLQLTRIENTEGKIFDRINQIADKK